MTSPMCRAMQESQKKLVISKGRLLRSTWKFLQIAPRSFTKDIYVKLENLKCGCDNKIM